MGGKQSKRIVKFKEQRSNKTLKENYTYDKIIIEMPFETYTSYSIEQFFHKLDECKNKIKRRLPKGSIDFRIEFEFEEWVDGNTYPRLFLCFKRPLVEKEILDKAKQNYVQENNERNLYLKLKEKYEGDK